MASEVRTKGVQAFDERKRSFLKLAGIHSVEACHAAEARRVLGVRSWNGAFDKLMSKAQPQVLSLSANAPGTHFSALQPRLSRLPNPEKEMS